MIQLIVLGVLCSAAALNASPTGGRPAILDAAAEARRLVHEANWASVGTFSSIQSGYPMVSVLSTSDSVLNQDSTGDIYFLLLQGDIPTADVSQNENVAFLFSDAQQGKCGSNDPMGHRCPRAMLTGKVVKVDKDSAEYQKGMAAYSSRHAFASNFEESGHKFDLYKLDIKSVHVFSGYSGNLNVPLPAYQAGTDGIPAKE